MDLSSLDARKVRKGSPSGKKNLVSWNLYNQPDVPVQGGGFIMSSPLLNHPSLCLAYGYTSTEILTLVSARTKEC